MIIHNVIKTKYKGKPCRIEIYQSGGTGFYSRLISDDIFGIVYDDSLFYKSNGSYQEALKFAYKYQERKNDKIL